MAFIECLEGEKCLKTDLLVYLLTLGLHKSFFLLMILLRNFVIISIWAIFGPAPFFSVKLSVSKYLTYTLAGHWPVGLTEASKAE